MAPNNSVNTFTVPTGTVYVPNTNIVTGSLAVSTIKTGTIKNLAIKPFDPNHVDTHGMILTGLRKLNPEVIAAPYVHYNHQSQRWETVVFFMPLDYDVFFEDEPYDGYVYNEGWINSEEFDNKHGEEALEIVIRHFSYKIEQKLQQMIQGLDEYKAVLR